MNGSSIYGCTVYRSCLIGSLVRQTGYRATTLSLLMPLIHSWQYQLVSTPLPTFHGHCLEYHAVCARMNLIYSFALVSVSNVRWGRANNLLPPRGRMAARELETGPCTVARIRHLNTLNGSVPLVEQSLKISKSVQGYCCGTAECLGLRV